MEMEVEMEGKEMENKKFHAAAKSQKNLKKWQIIEDSSSMMGLSQ